MFPLTNAAGDVKDEMAQPCSPYDKSNSCVFVQCVFHMAVLFIDWITLSSSKNHILQSGKEVPYYTKQGRIERHSQSS